MRCNMTIVSYNSPSSPVFNLFWLLARLPGRGWLAVVNEYTTLESVTAHQ